MNEKRTWIIEDEVVALYVAMYKDSGLGLDYEVSEIDEIIANTLFCKEGFNMRVGNYTYIITNGERGLDAGYPNGYPPYRELYQIFASFDQNRFKDYVNMILKRREESRGRALE